MKECIQILPNELTYCDALLTHIRKTKMTTKGLPYCPFCRNSLELYNSGDPWLYPGAIIQIWNKTATREKETICYNGGRIDSDFYMVRGTPWEMVPPDCEKIAIDDQGVVMFHSCGRMQGFKWLTCPDQLKGLPRDFLRPAWTAFLQEVKK